MLRALRKAAGMYIGAAIESMEEIIREFLIESAENVDVLDRDLIALEREPDSRELLAEIFRAIHTLKGNSGALGYPKLEAVAHAGEDLLTGLRDGKIALSRELSNGLLAMVDALRGLLSALDENGDEGDGDCTSVVGLLRGLTETSGPAKEADERVEARSETADDPRCPNRAFSAASKTGVANPAPVSTFAAESLPEAAGASSGSIRISVSLLDRIMNLMGELILARNQVLHVASQHSGADFIDAAQRLKSVTSSLQYSVMKARLQPVGNLWNKLPRLVRDMAAKCGKQIAFEMKGSEIELDRTILEAIKDPLTHILRNAIDHGIELPERRIRAGKPAAGQLRLRAFHEGGRVYVEISDDGAGIDVPCVRQRAVDRELMTAEQAASMSERDLARLVFTPGFSTAETVTNLSGRGVGLDVVRINIERVGGVVDLQSVTGQGTTVKIDLPLTLAILPALIVSSGGEHFAVPQGSLLELVRLELDCERNPIEQIYGAPVYRLRDRLLPLVCLDRVLHLPEQNAGTIHVVVLQAGARQFGLVVDVIGDTEEIVVKPPSKQLKGLACFAGAAILGDGRVVLILDVAGVAQLANLSAERPSGVWDEAAAIETSSITARQSWVTFRGATGTRFALPMSAVARLEEIPSQKVERSHGREAVQYRGEILPLLRIADLFHEPSPERELLQVLVLREAGESVGLVVDSIEDITEEAAELRPSRRSDLLQGPAVIHNRVADVLDVKRVLALAGEPFIPATGSR